MRISDRYIAKQVLLGTLYAVVVLGLVLVLGDLFKRLQPLLVEQKAPPELVMRFVISVLPLSLMYTIPWGFLSALLLVFGKLSANHEITSFRVAGVSLGRLAAPVFVLGVVLSLLSLWLNGEVVPRSKATSRQLVYEQAARDASSLLKPGVVQGDFRGDGESTQKLLIESRNGEWVEGFNFYVVPENATDPQEMTYVHAARAALSVDREKSQLRVKLEDAYFESRTSDGKTSNVFAGHAEPLLINLKDPHERESRPGSMTDREILNLLESQPAMDKKRKLELKVEMVKRHSFSFASLAFAFIAVPLGLQSRRRDTSKGLVLSLLIGICYFLVLMFSDHFSTEKAATIMLWAPNAVCVVLGFFLFRRARFK